MSKEIPNLELAKSRPVMEAILNRRDVRKFLDKPVPKEVIESLLYAAIWAPNHKLTEPWRFVVISPEKKSEFIEKFVEGALSMGSNPIKLVKAKVKAEKAKIQFPTIPLFIAAAYKQDPDPIVSQENLITAACGLQNMLLAAEELGISAHWSTTSVAKTKTVLDYLGFASDEEFMGLFHMGYCKEKGRMKRSGIETFVHWK